MRMFRTPPVGTRRQRGIGLLEALIAFLVLCLGMLAIARVQGDMRLNAEVARQRSEAVRLAQEDIESLRAYAVLAAASGPRSFEAIESATRTVDAAAGYATNTVYRVTRLIDDDATLPARNARVTVGWTDRRGAAQQVVLSSVIAANAPAYGAALGLARSSTPVRGPLGRSVRIPFTAKDLGDGRSAFKPVGGGTVALVFGNASGLLIGRCAAVAANTSTNELTIANLGPCDTHVGYLLGGVVRFTAASPPDAAHAADPPPAVSIALALTGGTYATATACSTETMISAAGDRFVAWHCAVYPLANGRWSGRATLVPNGWTIGTGATDRRVCRYSADLDASGAIDANVEHPWSWVGVDASLLHQDFLVIGGSETCPSGHAVRVAGNNDDVHVDLGTEPHQP